MLGGGGLQSITLTTYEDSVSLPPGAATAGDQAQDMQVKPACVHIAQPHIHCVLLVCTLIEMLLCQDRHRPQRCSRLPGALLLI